MNLLLIEDEITTANYLKKGLTETGFSVTVANDGYQGEQLALSNAYDLIILDLRLPGQSGLSILNKIRQKFANRLVLILTACDSVPERVSGLENGADDYLTKPFAFSELVARVRNLLKRSNSENNKLILKIADLTINIAERKASRNNNKICLTSKEFLLLILLAKNPGRIYSRTEISEKVWDIHFHTETNTVDVAIRRLRQKIDLNFEKKLIHTVRGMGYVLEER